jgi:hypothetical protein
MQFVGKLGRRDTAVNCRACGRDTAAIGIAIRFT